MSHRSKVLRRRQYFFSAVVALIIAAAVFVPNFSSQAILKGDSFLLNRDLPAARQAYQEALDSSPDSWRAHNRMGRVLAELGDLKNSVQYHQAAVDLAPENPEALACLARGNLRNGNESEAAEVLATLLRNDPANFEALFLMAEVENAQGRHEQAKFWLLKILEHHPHNFIAHGQLALTLKSVDPEQSVKFAWRCLQSGASPQWQKIALLTLVESQLKLREEKQAQESARILTRMYPGSAQAGRARVLLDKI